jgi:hypothetical protein
MGKHPPCRLGALPVAELPFNARVYAQYPCARHTDELRQYYLRSFEKWCASKNLTPWPLTAEALLQFASESAATKSYWTIRGGVRVISLEERKRSGVDLFALPAMQRLLNGIKRDRPPQPVQPLRPSQLNKLLDFRPRTAPQRVGCAIVLLSYCCGLNMIEHANFRVEMVRFEGDGAWIEGLSDDRPRFYVGPAQNPNRCPVRALRELVANRQHGPMYLGARCRSPERGLSYQGIVVELGRLGRIAGVSPLSNNRIRLAGMIEQSKKIDIVRLAHFHGYRKVGALANLLGRYLPTSVGAWKRQRRARTSER